MTNLGGIDRPDQQSTHDDVTDPDGTCEASDLGLRTVSTLERFIYQDNIQHTGMCRIRVSDFSLRNLDLDLSHVQDANRTTAHLKYNTISLSQQPGILIISSHESPLANASCPTFTDTLRIKYSYSDLEAIFESPAILRNRLQQRCTAKTST